MNRSTKGFGTFWLYYYYFSHVFVFVLDSLGFVHTRTLFFGGYSRNCITYLPRM